MCAIDGYIDMENGLDINLLVSMTNIVKHRGPDDEGYFTAGKDSTAHYHGDDSHPAVKTSTPPVEDGIPAAFVGLGHRRLSIMDLSEAGHQPMEKHGKVIVFNGMIYNYIELQNELRSLGYTFAGNCDTEVILSAYDCWGEDCVSRFNGMWGFAIYDTKEHTVFLSRDRFGIKPLYYYQAGSKFLFSSEIKQILADSTIKRKVNMEIMASYLFFGFQDYCGQTFYKDIYQIPGGHNAKIKLDFESRQISEFKTWQFYSVNDLGRNGNAAAESGCQKPSEVVEKEFTRAVKWRLRSDVKLGSCLSGGMDSSSIVAVACKELEEQGLSPAEFETVTSTYKDSPEADETEYSRAVAEYCGCRENLIYTETADVQNGLEKVCWHEDEPPSGFTVHQWRVYEKASMLGCKVLLDGQGGDETLGGYNQYFWMYLYETFKNKGLREFVRELKRCAENTRKPIVLALVWTFYSRARRLRLRQMKFTRSRYFGKQTRKNVNDETAVRLLYSDSGTGLQKLDISSVILPILLHEVDRMSMAHALEVRLPFMDYQFVEAAISIPFKDKVKDSFTKYPLREFIKDKLPETVVWRRNKLGFPIPGRKWVYGLDRAYIMDLLDNARSSGLFNIGRLKKRYLKKKVDIVIFTKFILVETWMRVFNVSV